MAEHIRLPVGVDRFEKIRREGFYYVDKTLLIEPEDPDAGIIIELKYAQTFAGLENACEKALAQIREKRYEERLREDGREKILAYGVAFYKKRCMVKVQEI